MRLVQSLFFLALASLFAAGCGEVTSASCSGEDFSTATNIQQVASEITLPTAATATQLAFDLDGNGKVDNTLGMLIDTVAQQAKVDAQGEVASAISKGDIIVLADVQATDLTNGCGKVSVYLGANPNPAPCTDPANSATCGQHLQGTGTFDIAANSPKDTSVFGTIKGGRFFLDKGDAPGNFSLELDIIDGQAPIRLDLLGARIEITKISPDGITGRIGGAIKSSDLQNTVLPTVVNLVNGVVMTDCMLDAANVCQCAADSPGKIIADLFDKDDNCSVSAEELSTDPIISSLLLPDVDLLDASGNFAAPDADGTLDSLSIAVGFSTKKATFTAP